MADAESSRQDTDDITCSSHRTERLGQVASEPSETPGGRRWAKQQEEDRRPDRKHGFWRRLASGWKCLPASRRWAIGVVTTVLSVGILSVTAFVYSRSTDSRAAGSQVSYDLHATTEHFLRHLEEQRQIEELREELRTLKQRTSQ